jgi:mRNA-degrading endonuclease YafQ of YafQ-DinJ toxin-antitoxin module
LREIILLPIERSRCPARCKDHPLEGDWKHYRDLYLVRT